MVDQPTPGKMMIVIPLHVDDEIRDRVTKFRALHPDVVAETTQEDMEEDMRFIWASRGVVAELRYVKGATND